MRRELRAVAVGTAVIAVALFYLFAPTVTAYFSEVFMDCTLAPKATMRMLPARVTAQIFDRFNLDAPRALAFQQELTCNLVDAHGVAVPRCTVEVRGGDAVSGPPDLKLASGRYVAAFDFSSNDRCGLGSARVEVDVDGRFKRQLVALESDLHPGEHLELPFRLRLMDAALGTVSVHVVGISDCVLLTHATWSRS